MFDIKEKCILVAIYIMGLLRMAHPIFLVPIFILMPSFIPVSYWHYLLSNLSKHPTIHLTILHRYSPKNYCFFNLFLVLCIKFNCKASFVYHQVFKSKQRECDFGCFVPIQTWAWHCSLLLLGGRANIIP